MFTKLNEIVNFDEIINFAINQEREIIEKYVKTCWYAKKMEFTVDSLRADYLSPPTGKSGKGSLRNCVQHLVPCHVDFSRNSRTLM